MEENQIRNDVAYIRSMIENNRRSLVDNGITYISIGIYIVVGVVASYILGIKGMTDYLPPLWLLLMGILITFNLIYKKKHGDRKSPKLSHLRPLTQYGFHAVSRLRQFLLCIS